MPDNQKSAQRVLGVANYFNGHVPNYSDVSADLAEMTRATFNWDRSAWTKDYEGSYRKFLQALQDATENFYPDYGLDWILRTDAFENGCGGY
jgi:hypothetical protein